MFKIALLLVFYFKLDEAFVHIWILHKVSPFVTKLPVYHHLGQGHNILGTAVINVLKQNIIKSNKIHEFKKSRAFLFFFN